MQQLGMPCASSEIHNEVKESLPGENGSSKSNKRLKGQSESHADKVAVTSSKRKAECSNKSKINKSSKRNLTICSFLKKSKSLKKSSLSSQKDDLYIITMDNGELGHSGHFKYRDHKEKRRRMKKKGDMKLDEASRLQRRTKYLLIKMKLEQNLIDAYSGEGWKRQSREKIKPETELRRAKEQILKCKLGIREVIHQLDSLSSVGCIDDSVVAPDGSVHHEHIICAKCKLREPFPDNDIILCDGTCNRAFHQNCLDPPLTTENRDEGWFCKFCKSKMEILESTNAHLGTDFPLDSNWQDIFKEEAVLPEGGDSLVVLEPDWPSDESDDDDYDPDKIENSTVLVTSESQNSASSSSFSTLGSLEEDLLFLTGRDSAPDFFIGADCDETADCEVASGRRQRPTVNYIKLNDELFGKNTPIEEQISEDEDWGPTGLKRRGKESDAASSRITPSVNTYNGDRETAEDIMHGSMEIRRPLVRIPHNAVEQLRTVFSENELPSRTIRESLAKQLNLEFEKVNKWFKNSRYLALKARKGGMGKLCQSSSKALEVEGILETAEHGPPNSLVSNPTGCLPNLTSVSDEKINALPITRPLTVKQRKREIVASPTDKRPTADFDDDVSLKFLREAAEKKRFKGKKQHTVRVLEAEVHAMTGMEKLCRLKDKIQSIHQVLLGLVDSNPGKSYMATENKSAVVFIPVAELNVKR